MFYLSLIFLFRKIRSTIFADEDENEEKKEKFTPNRCCSSRMYWWFSKHRLPPTRSKRIDVIARIIFPIVFAIFNLTYWLTYLTTHEMRLRRRD